MILTIIYVTHPNVRLGILSSQEDVSRKSLFGELAIVYPKRLLGDPGISFLFSKGFMVMEKLIELLKESGKADEICPTGIDIRKQYFDEGNITRADRMMYEYLCSKHFGFIERLVENKKIDTDAYKTVYSGDLDKRKTLTMSSEGDEFYQVTEHGVYESLLMLLSISDTPIEDLISYLK